MIDPTSRLLKITSRMAYNIAMAGPQMRNDKPCRQSQQPGARASEWILGFQPHVVFEACIYRGERHWQREHIIVRVQGTAC